VNGRGEGGGCGRRAGGAGGAVGEGKRTEVNEMSNRNQLVATGRK